MEIITTTQALEALCTRLGASPYVALDTEFMRERTYYPILCLIQIATPAEAAIIDPLAEGLSLDALWKLLATPTITKVFHAARQDLEIFHLRTGTLPKPLFDTQIAAAVCGFGESVSYDTLAQELAGVQLDKSSRFTDWSKRPLSEKQLTYAISDVTHLCTIYEALVARIEESGRTRWTSEEHARLADPALYEQKPIDAWKRLKAGHMRPKNLAVLRALAAWREQEAQKNDVPRGRVVKDELLVQLAAQIPKSAEDFRNLRGLEKPFSKARSEAILAAVSEALALPASEYPNLPKPRKQDGHAAALAMLQLLLKIKSEKHGIAAPMIANKEALESIALGQTDLPALSGWRAEIFGHKAVALMQGKLKLALDPKTKEVVFEEN